MKKFSPSQLNVVLAAAFWLVTVGAYSANSSSQDLGEMSEESGFVESRASRLARANLIRFRESAPRQDLILLSLSKGCRHPNDITLYLSRDWDATSSATKEQLKERWRGVWVKATKPTTSRQKRPHIQFQPTHRKRSLFQG